MLLADGTISLVASKGGAAISDRFRRTAIVSGIAAANLPDLDVVYAGAPLQMGPLGYLLHHRGYSHTIAWAIIGGVLLWLMARWWFNRSAGDQDREWMAAHGSIALLALAIAGSLSHIALDYTNSYGVHPFWPLDDRWYYGDAIFIVEPWLWLIAIPALIWRPRAFWGRIILAVLLMVILVAAWRVGVVEHSIVVAMSAFAILWLGIHYLLSDRARTMTGIAAWLAVTAVFFTASSAAHASVAEIIERSRPREDVGAPKPGRLLDAVLNPSVGDPSCWSVIAVSTDGIFYRLSTGMVAPFPSLRTVADCRQIHDGRSLRGDGLMSMDGASLAVPFDSSSAVAWRRTYAVARSEMISFASERCEFVGALRFMRTPVWSEAADGELTIFDLRFGAAGFASMKLPGWPHDCSLKNSWVPPWVPPRMDVLTGS